jgi:hypothetical protein
MMIWTSTIFLTAVAALSPPEVSLLVPTVKPTFTQDPWPCVDKNIPQYFEVPMPTESLRHAIFTHGAALRQRCPDQAEGKCPRPEKSDWCSFSKSAPTPLLTEYTSWGREASVWWASHSSKAISVAQICPNGWYRWGRKEVTTQSWFNLTIIFAECYAEAYTTSLPPTTKSTLATPGKSGSVQAMKTATGRGIWGRGEDMDKLMIAGAGLAFAAMNEVW